VCLHNNLLLRGRANAAPTEDGFSTETWQRRDAAAAVAAADGREPRSGRLDAIEAVMLDETHMIDVDPTSSRELSSHELFDQSGRWLIGLVAIIIAAVVVYLW
jgi:hypothetical protein